MAAQRKQPLLRPHLIRCDINDPQRDSFTIFAHHLVPAFALLTTSALASPYRTTPIQITADLSKGFCKIYHAEMHIPVAPVR